MKKLVALASVTIVAGCGSATHRASTPNLVQGPAATGTTSAPPPESVAAPIRTFSDTRDLVGLYIGFDTASESHNAARDVNEYVHNLMDQQGESVAAVSTTCTQPQDYLDLSCVSYIDNGPNYAANVNQQLSLSSAARIEAGWTGTITEPNPERAVSVRL